MPKIRDSGMPLQEQWESFFDPPGILDSLACKDLSGDIVELGCGYGTFTEAAAARTSANVYAMDIDPTMVAATAARVLRAGYRNVVTERRDFIIDGFGRPDESVSYVLMFNILHADDPTSLLREARRVLRPRGLIGVIHWNVDAGTPRGPPLDIRPFPEQCQRWAEYNQLECLASPILPRTPWHWGMILRR